MPSTEITPVENLERLGSLKVNATNKQGLDIERGLARLAHQFFGRDIPILTDTARSETSSIYKGPLRQQSETTYYALVTDQPFCDSTYRKQFGINRATSYLIFAISKFSYPDQETILIAGRPTLSHPLRIGNEVTEWQHPFRESRPGVSQLFLEELLKDYAAQGPSLVLVSKTESLVKPRPIKVRGRNLSRPI